MTDLPAGRELDALIERQVFGIASSHPVGISPDGSFAYLLPPYSTDLNAAWEVALKLGAGFSISLVDDVEDSEEPWNASLYEGVVQKHQAWGATAPLAICHLAVACYKNDG